jgi:hypothetical protein
MILNLTDTFIEIGSQHKICEDYIIGRPAYIILADGCSSSENSEMGARFLCYMAKQFIKIYGPTELTETMGRWIIYNAETLSRNLGLPKTCLDATLIISYVKNGFIHIHMFGDGFLVLCKEIPEYEIYCIDYKAGSRSMPYYLRYLVDEESSKIYHNQKVVKTLRRTAIYENGQLGYAIPEEFAYDHFEYFKFGINDFKSISICSDGLGSFLTSKPNETGNKIVKVEDIVPKIFNFSGSNGVFLQRQMNIFNRSNKKSENPLNHYDDLSIGTYLMEEEPNAKDDSLD